MRALLCRFACAPRYCYKTCTNCTGVMPTDGKKKEKNSFDMTNVWIALAAVGGTVLLCGLAVCIAATVGCCGYKMVGMTGSAACGGGALCGPKKKSEGASRLGATRRTPSREEGAASCGGA